MPEAEVGKLERRIEELGREIERLRERLETLERWLERRGDHPTDRAVVRQKVAYDWQQ